MKEMKGWGVVTTKPFDKGAFVAEYSGDLITNSEAKAREAAYIEEDRRNGVVEPMCYMYFLQHADRKYWYGAKCVWVAI